jgi:subtilisin family serine protease
VIAVTATDCDDKLFDRPTAARTSRSRRPALRSSRAPGESYQMQSGTSFAAAQVSGVAALLRERNRQLDPPHPPHPDLDGARSRPRRARRSVRLRAG